MCTLFRYVPLILLLLGCERTPGQWFPETPEVPELPTLNAIIVFQSSTGTEHTVNATVATTHAERGRGLMFRREALKDDEAMLFVMDDDSDHGFWMKNTFIPLDMVFVSLKGKVVGVAERAEPHTTQSRSVGLPSRYVIEVDAGWCERHAIRAGDAVSISITPLGS